jgi:hypothetical protein
MKPYLKNKVCAHPELLIMITCFLFAVTVISCIIPLNFEVINIVGFFAITALVTLFGFMGFWNLTRKTCSKANGAPYQVNETVLIITGTDRNKFGLIRSIEKSQGGWPLLVLEIDHQDKEKSQRTCEEYSVMRIK